MTHDEYASRIESWTDEDAAAVLEHASACSECRGEARRASNALASLAPARRSRAEEAFRIAAAAAVAALVVWMLPSNLRQTDPSAGAARYRIVGTSSGVVAETPEGVVAAGHPELDTHNHEETSR
jgi:ferric-dicitrate binding protein FerR (iron transport regulator)